MFDLTITPQWGTVTAGAHLDDQDATHATQDWLDFGTIKHPTANGTWTVAVRHIRQGQPTLTSLLLIPRSEVNAPVPYVPAPEDMPIPYILPEVA